jgi:hypothetical protein
MRQGTGEPFETPPRFVHIAAHKGLFGTGSSRIWINTILEVLASSHSRFSLLLLLGVQIKTKRIRQGG